MKILIVGAGVSGLSLCLQLRRVPHIHEIVIFESHDEQHDQQHRFSVIGSVEGAITDSSHIVGNSIALTPGGLQSLKHIDGDLYELFISRGYINKTYSFRSATGHKITDTPVGGDGATSEAFTVSCPRQLLRNCLREILGDQSIRYEKVKSVDLNSESPFVVLVDGTLVYADLIVGSDGAQSLVRKAMFADDDDDPSNLHFEQYCGVGGFIDREIPESITARQSIVFTLGTTGSFGYCAAAPESSGKIGWWSNWPEKTLPDKNVVNPDEVRQQLRSRHGSWSDPVIQHIVQNAKVDYIYPIWTTPPLPYWGNDHAVLLGDACHTLQATSGQGACQALEDSIVFSTLLSHYLSQNTKMGTPLSTQDAVRFSTKGLYHIRNHKVKAIKEGARNFHLKSMHSTNPFVQYLYYLLLLVHFKFSFIRNFVFGKIFEDNVRISPEVEVQRYIEANPV